MNEIDINRADLETLAYLNGIGEKLAARIITYRETVHPFEEIIELAAVPGISERMVRAIADEITVGSQPVPGEVSDTEVGESLAPEAAAVPLPQVSPASEMDASAEEDQSEEADTVAAPEEPDLAGEPGGDEGMPEVPSDVEVLLLPEEPAGAEQGEEAPEPPTTEESVEPAADLPDEAGLPAAPPPRQGCASRFTTLLAVLLGALLGAGITLFLLYALNGTLDFASPAEVAGLQSQVDAQETEQSGLGEDVSALSGRLDEVTAAEATTAAGFEDRAGELEEEIADLEETMADNVATMEAETAVIATRVDGLSAAAENFDLFLDGMRDLLVELRGLPPLPTATPTLTVTATITPTAAVGTPAATETPEGTPTAESSPTPTPFVTRTPRPTATPFVSPSATAVNIP